MESSKRSNKNILILSNSHPYKAAGIVALDLYKGLKKNEQNNVKLLVNVYDKYSDKNIISIQTSVQSKIKWIFRKFRNVLNRLEIYKSKLKKTNRDYSIQDYYQTKTYWSTDKILKKAGFKPDIVIVLFMQSFLSFKNVYEINQITKAPVFLYLMDMAPFTGGCHYAWNCENYMNKCGKCPAYKTNNEIDQSTKNWEYKKQYIEKTNITAIAGSEWLYIQLKKSSLFKNKAKQKILLSIDSELFKPNEKNKAREYFNLPVDKKVIFFGAVSYGSKRKGYVELINALKVLKENSDENLIQNIHLVIAGKGNSKLTDDFPFTCSFIGYLTHEKLAKAFQAADVFVSPSIEDSGPMMINQSIMSGTPVVAFEIGVAIDLVITKKTGYRAILRDSADFANGVRYILNLDIIEYNEISTNCRNLGLKSCNSTTQINKFIDIL